MTDVKTAGAASREAVHWQSINWQQAHRNVRRLQARIVQATQAGRWNRVKALQRLLTRSFSARALAVKRVTENQGARTSGVDGILWKTPQDKAAAVNDLQPHGYQPQPLRRIYIPKADGVNWRPLGIPTMKDRAMQALYLLALEPVAETTADPNSYGFRKERSCHDAIGQCFIILGRRNTATWVMEGDIKACFDRISHDWLLQNIPLERTILRKWLKAGYMERSQLYSTDEGTPQGGVISPVLANMALDGLEPLLLQHFPKPKHPPAPKVNFVRYADDFIVSGASRELLEQRVKPLIEQFLRERGLELSPTKTLITPLDQGFDFLGQNIRSYQGKLLIKPARKNVKALLMKVRQRIKQGHAYSAGLLIHQLNPVLRGWALYHRHIVCKDTFAKVDHHIFWMLWRWACHQHPTKSSGWIKRRYFQRVGNRDWIFTDQLEGKQQRLHPCMQVAVRRHTKIQGPANPFDPQWEVYFERRLGLKMADTLYGRRQLLQLWKEQNGRCPVCQEKITPLTGWHSHHLIQRSLGGSDANANRVLLHPNCHYQAHTLKLPLVKPRRSPNGV